MHNNPFTLKFEKLPRTLPVFPLAGAVVMPHAQLPLNIFEPRYLNMVNDVLGQHRMIGMVQPANPAEAGAEPEIHRTGGAGRITSFSETGDGRFLIILTGVCRFDVIERLRTTRSYSTAVANWQRFSVDYRQDPAQHLDKDQLLEVLRRYAGYHRLDVDWKSLSGLDPETLVNALITNLPLSSDSKQALVESVGIAERRDLLLATLANDLGSREKPMTH